jgi:peptidoglycan/LPS O-acetylase OafA/YrhL
MAYHFGIRVPPAEDGLAESLMIGLCRAGWIGVDLFFVLSGFLITGILCDTRHDQRYFSTFYARRALRIFPAYYGLLVVYFIITPLLLGDRASQFTIEPTKQCWFWFYSANWLFAKEGSFELTKGGYLWSLSIEEQFYVLWPVVIAILPLRQLSIMCAAVSAAIWVARPLLVFTGTSTTSVYVMTITHIDGLLLGALVAVACRSGHFKQLSGALYCCAGPAALGVVVVTMAASGHFVFYYEPVAAFGMTCTTMLSAAFLCAGIAPGQYCGLKYILEGRVLRSMGELSYAIYLVHVPVGAALAWLLFGSQTTHLGSFGLFTTVSYMGGSTAICWCLAMCSWYAYEAPILRLKRLFPYSDRARVQVVDTAVSTESRGASAILRPAPVASCDPVSSAQAVSQ